MLPVLSEFQLDPVPACLAEVEEIAEACLLRSHKQQVVVILTEEVIRAPMKSAQIVAADSHFKCSRNNLFERRVAHERIWQVAGLVRICATQLDRCRSAACLTVIEVSVEEARGLIGKPGSRVEALKDVAAGQVTPRRGDGQIVSIVERGVVVTA